MTFRDYFDRVYIINLPERTDRRADMEKELDAAGLSLTAGHIEFFPAVKVADAAGFANAGYHGCFRSHLDVFRKARDGGARHLLVFEDDAALSPHFRRDEESVVAQLQARPWGLVLLGHEVLEPPSDRPTMLVPFPGQVGLSHFYAVHFSILDPLIEFFEAVLRRPPGDPDGGPMSPDGALNFFLARNQDVPAFVSRPNFGGQRSSRSDILPRWFDRIPGMRQTAGFLRRAKRWFRQN
jgi:glycosyl transferase, family 25